MTTRYHRTYCGPRLTGALRRRFAFTLLEVIVAMLSATILLLGLAATVSVTMSTLAFQSSRPVTTSERVVADRMGADLRYAITVADDSSGFALTRHHPTTGLVEQVTYSVAVDGVERTLANQTADLLDAQLDQVQSTSDSYIPPSSPALTTSVLVRGTSVAATEEPETNLTIDYPAGASDGDLMVLAVAGKYGTTGITGPAGWSTVRDTANALVRQTVYFRYYSASEASSPEIVAPSPTPLAACMLCIDQCHPHSPWTFTNSATGFAFGFSVTLPVALQPTEMNPRRLLIQSVAAENNPWPWRTLGMASFVDACHVVACPDESDDTVSLAVAIRRGRTPPDMATTPRSTFSSIGRWVLTAAEVEVAP